MPAWAIEEFEHYVRQTAKPEVAETYLKSLGSLRRFLHAYSLSSITPADLRRFISRWFVDHDSLGIHPQEFLTSLEEFFAWTERVTRDPAAGISLNVVKEFSQSLPRATEITRALTDHLTQRRGSFSFPEFLTTFAEGGQSQYDLDVAGEGEGPGALEGYFRLRRVDGQFADVEEIISGETAWPVVFPVGAARLIEPDFIINLEIIRSGTGWEITACGFAYPPSAEF